MVKKTKTIKCEDKNCPIHGSLSLHGRSFKGIVVSTKMHKSAIVEWTRKVIVPKYERYVNKKTRVSVHVPECMEIKVGDSVLIHETRPLSKTKNFVIIKKMDFIKKHIIKEESKDNADLSIHKKDTENIDQE